MYECIKNFIIDVCDGDGFTVESDGYIVNKGTLWDINEEAINVIGAEIHLENNDNWIEISKDILNEHFIKIEKD